MLNDKNGDPGIDEPLEPMELKDINEMTNQSNHFENYYQDPVKALKFTQTLDKPGSIYIDLGRGSHTSAFNGFISSIENADMLVRITLTFWS